MIRQGDILLVPVDLDAPKDAQRSDLVILAEGELTGHAHRLRGNVAVWNVGEQRYVRVEGEAGTLQHEDHDPAPAAVVEPDVTYKVIPQRAYARGDPKIRSRVARPDRKHARDVVACFGVRDARPQAREHLILVVARGCRGGIEAERKDHVRLRR